MIVCPVILAGGFGKRLEPVSSIEKPKQFISFFEGGKSCFQQTIRRIRNVFINEKIVIVCNRLHLDIVKMQLSQIVEKNYILIVENESKNTFCSLLLVLKYIEQNNIKIDTLFVSTTDSYIENNRSFASNLRTSLVVSFLKNKHIVFGVKPTNANIHYGYIKFNTTNKFSIFDDGMFLKVERFTEKPDYKTAEKFMKSHNYLWNSGNFVFNYKLLLNEIKKYQQYVYDIFVKMKLQNNSKQKNIFETDGNFLHLQDMQIDKAIVEKSKHLICCKADFDWCDVGSFEVITRLLIKGKIMLENANYLLLMRNNNFLKTKSSL